MRRDHESSRRVDPARRASISGCRHPRLEQPSQLVVSHGLDFEQPSRDGVERLPVVRQDAPRDGVFIAQAVTSSYVGAVTTRDRALAVGLYSTFYWWTRRRSTRFGVSCTGHGCGA